MNLGRCPICHARLQLEALCQDEAARELLALLAGLDGGLGRALVSYLGLFRPARGDLPHDRALRLARAALALCPDSMRLAMALAETTETIRGKNDGRAMRNHNYLLRVLEGTPAATAGTAVVAAEARPRPASKHRAALDAIDGD